MRISCIYDYLPSCFLNIAAITTGTRNSAVTELILISVGANTVLAIPSQKVSQLHHTKTPRNQDNRARCFVAILTRCGTAIPTKEIGPANAVTQADRRLDKRIIVTLNTFTLTPIFLAYASPI